MRYFGSHCTYQGFSGGRDLIERRTDASEAIKDVDVLAGVQVVDGTLAVDLERVLVHLDVDGTPPDVVLARLLKDDTLVLGRATGLLPGEVDQGSRGGDDGAFVADGVFVELRDRGVALDVLCEIRKEVRSCAMLGDRSAYDVLHVKAGLGEHLQVLADEAVGWRAAAERPLVRIVLSRTFSTAFPHHPRRVRRRRRAYRHLRWRALGVAPCRHACSAVAELYELLGKSRARTSIARRAPPEVQMLQRHRKKLLTLRCGCRTPRSGPWGCWCGSPPANANARGGPCCSSSWARRGLLGIVFWRVRRTSASAYAHTASSVQAGEVERTKRALWTAGRLRKSDVRHILGRPCGEQQQRGRSAYGSEYCRSWQRRALELLWRSVTRPRLTASTGCELYSNGRDTTERWVG